MTRETKVQRIKREQLEADVRNLMEAVKVARAQRDLARNEMEEQSSRRNAAETQLHRAGEGNRIAKQKLFSEVLRLHIKSARLEGYIDRVREEPSKVVDPKPTVRDESIRDMLLRNDNEKERGELLDMVDHETLDRVLGRDVNPFQVD